MLLAADQSKLSSSSEHLGPKRLVALLAVIGILLLSPHASAGETVLGAYYTQLNTGQPWEAFSRTGQFADVVVNVPGGTLVFWRGNSYLPYWKTAGGQWNLAEIIPRSGDGMEPMPDRNNVYSHVEVVENTPQKVVVLWRYLSSFKPGNPHANVQLTNFVDELFTITPDGKVVRVIKKATDQIDSWNDPSNQEEQDLKLTQNGIVELGRKHASISTISNKIVGNPSDKKPVIDPVLWFKFDEGTGTETTEAVTHTTLPIVGPKALWKKGVSGTALEFDGYNSVVCLPAAQAPKLSGSSVTLEGWFALGAYPWNWAPLVQQGDNKGYFLGIDGHGYPGFMLEVNGVWQQLTVAGHPPYTDSNHLQLFHWYQIAGTYDHLDGMMRLYVDGKEVANKLVGTGGLQTANADVRLGKAGILRTPTDGTHDTKPSDYGLDGVIDEVRVYGQALNAAEISQSFNNFNPGENNVAAPDMQKRHLPLLPNDGKFGVSQTHLAYYETWDNLWCADKYSDLVVQFDQSPEKVVFWRGASYIPILVNESNQWYMNEFNETGFSKDAPGDYEPMSDKACLDSHIRVIENNDARVVVHWRYRLARPDHLWAFYDAKTGWGDIADWYYYIYPDGVVSKRMRCYSSRPDAWHEWDEQIVVFGEGQHPEGVINKVPVMTLVDKTGKAFDYDWNPDPPKPAYRDKMMIQMIHLTGRFSPFTIQAFNNGDIYKGERTWYSVFPSWNHWPTAQINSSGRNASFPDRAAHSSISHLFWPYTIKQQGNIPFQEKNLLEGMTDQPAASLTDLARSWLNAPGISAVIGGTSLGYDQAQRAYPFTIDSGKLTFQIDSTTESPIDNLCFVVKKWGDRLPSVSIDGRPLTHGPDFRYGYVPQREESDLIVWVNLSSSSPVHVEMSGSKISAN